MKRRHKEKKTIFENRIKLVIISEWFKPIIQSTCAKIENVKNCLLFNEVYKQEDFS